MAFIVGDALVAAAITAQTLAMSAWEAARLGKEIATDIAAYIQLGLQATQMVAYYSAADDAIDDRDDKIDAQLDFMQTLQDLKYNQDLPMVLCKRDVLISLNLPTIDRCFSATEIGIDSRHDGYAVVAKSNQFLDETCEGIPSGWKNHEGLLHSAKSSSYTGGLLANSELRRVEQFRSSKTRLVSTAQAGMKSIFNAGEILNKYAQAAAVHSGLADLYIQGFNSAGAALGANLGRLASGTQPGINDSAKSATINDSAGISLDAGTANDVEGLA